VKNCTFGISDLKMSFHQHILAKIAIFRLKRYAFYKIWAVLKICTPEVKIAQESTRMSTKNTKQKIIENFQLEVVDHEPGQLLAILT